MANTLFVPIEIDALYVKDTMPVAGDFRLNRLPFLSVKQGMDINSDNAYLSETFLDRPFQNDNLFLKKGIHLHWFLPSVLMEGKTTDNSMEYPDVPNRWLVLKTVNNNITGRWIVESDYLHNPEKGYVEGSSMLPLKYPYEDKVKLEHAPSYCFAGRTINLDSDIKEPEKSDREAKYITDIEGEKLNAVSNGTLQFSVVYPFCRSIFGFHDPDGTVEEKAKYYVTGWNGDNKLNSISRLVDSEELCEKMQSEEFDTVDKAIMDILGWEIRTGAGLKGDALNIDRDGNVNDNKIKAFADEKIQMLFFATIEFGEGDAEKCNINSEKCKMDLTIANTKEEALNAYLATKITENKEYHRKIVEEQLTLSKHFEEVKKSDIDQKSVYDKCVHESGFTSVSGGILWEIVKEENSGDDSPEEKIPERVISKLRRLNTLQERCGKLEFELESMREQLFIDWYKYMTSCYPMEDSLNYYPDLDLIKNYINDILIETIEEKEKELNDENHLKKLKCLKDEIESELGTGLKLVEKSAPRYWQANNPVIMLTENTAKDKNACEKKSILTPVTNCAKFEKVEAGLEESGIDISVYNASSVKGQINKFREAVDRQAAGHIKWTCQPWKPFLLAWASKIAFSKDWNGSELVYSQNYINDKYILSEYSNDITEKSNNEIFLNDFDEDRISPGKDINIYSGFCILTSGTENNVKNNIEKISKEEVGEIANPYYAKLSDYREGLLKKKFRDYYTEEYLKKYLPKEFGSYNEFKKNPGYFGNPEKLQEIQGWLESDDVKLEKIDSLQETLNKAQNELESTVSLSQILDGFNEALIMRKETMQLRIDDPIGFDEYRIFTDRVRQHVKECNKTAPQPLNSFSPIRAGVMSILDLQLIDTFGQIRKTDIDIKNIIAPSHMQWDCKNNENYPVFLPPRLAQPARINARFLSAAQDQWDEQGEEHAACHNEEGTPICGWIVPENVTGSLYIFDNQGKMLGSIDINSEWNEVPGKESREENSGLLTENQIKNKHLRKTVNEILTLGKKSCSQKVNFVEHFLQMLNNSLANINPGEYQNDNILRILMGRPIAVVRATLNLELKGAPAINEDWQLFEHAAINGVPYNRRNNDKFLDVKFPIRVGNYHTLNDGIIGYWKEEKDEREDGGYRYCDDIFYAQQSNLSESEYIVTHWGSKTVGEKEKKEEVFINIDQSISDPPSKLTILMDPEKEITITSGILPEKKIKIPNEFFQEMLRKMYVNILVNPILTEENKYTIPLPKIDGSVWEWVERTGDSWNKISSEPIMKAEVLENMINKEFAGTFKNRELDAKECIKELTEFSWIEAKETGEEYVIKILFGDKTQNGIKPLKRFCDFEKEIICFFEKHSTYLASCNSGFNLSGVIPKAKEGWLVLKPGEDKA